MVSAVASQVICFEFDPAIAEVSVFVSVSTGQRLVIGLEFKSRILILNLSRTRP